MKNLELLVLALSLFVFLSIPACSSRTPSEGPGEAVEEKDATEVTLPADALKTAGIETADVVYKFTTRTIHVPGEITFNPKRQSHVTARSGGRIEQLLAYPGERVQKDQILLLLYTQDFLSVQAEYLQAAERLKRVSSDPVERVAAQSLYESAKTKLRALGLIDDDLSGIEKTDKLMTLLPVRAPLSGSIIESSLTQGDSVEIGADLFRIADLSTVWAHIHIFERDVATVRVGTDVVLQAGALPGRDFRGRLFQIGNVVDEKTRTVEARIELANADGQLRPGMFAEADIVSREPSRVLVVPQAAIQEFQNRKVVFVRTQANTFSLRPVETGAALDGDIEILKGLAEKESVASKGSFFLKSELLKKTLGEE